jgi:hypothetical protein
MLTLNHENLSIYGTHRTPFFFIWSLAFAMNSTLYLLVTERKTAFKIGITDNIENRYMRLRSVWGEFDLASSCMISGGKHEVYGIEKTLHFLLEKWRIDPSLKATGHSEWFSIECFDKAIEIINSATKLRDLQSYNKIIHGITVNVYKKHGKTRRTKPNRNISVKFDDLEKQWPYYEKGTLDFRDHPYREDTWLWTINISECLIHPMDAMRLQTNGAGINLVSEVCCYVNESSIIQMSIPKNSLSDIKKNVIFKQAYEFFSGKINALIVDNFSRSKSFDIESTPVFQNRP